MALTKGAHTGWGYYVQEPHKQKYKPKSYARSVIIHVYRLGPCADIPSQCRSNYLYSPGKLRIVSTK